MKNRILWILILSIFILIGFFYLSSREVEKKNQVEIWTWNLEETKKIPKLEKLEIKKQEEKKDNSEKIEDLKAKENNFAYFNFWEEKFYFNVKNGKLELKNNENNLWFFDLVLQKDLNISKIYPQNDLFLVEIWEKKYIYSKKNVFIKDFQTKLFINYSKFSDWNFIFFSDWKGSFVLYKNKNELEYFSIFNDFIFYWKWYLWIVNNSDLELKNRFGIKNDKNSVVFYVPENNFSKKVVDFDFALRKIWQENGKIFLENESWEKFILKDFEK